jgi:hypothetical protein
MVAIGPRNPCLLDCSNRHMRITREKLGKSQPGNDLEIRFWLEIRLLRNLRNNKLRMIAMSISKCTNRA